MGCDVKKIILAGLLALLPLASVADQWVMHEKKDEMRGASTYIAELRSKNTIELSSPHEGEVKLVIMMVSQDAKNILGTALILNNGRLVCQSINRCIISAKFDDGPVKEFSVSPVGSSGNALSISDFHSFAKDLNSSNKVFIEVPVYREGAAQFKFSPEPLAFDSK